jgi:hypothetical protein
MGIMVKYDFQLLITSEDKLPGPLGLQMSAIKTIASSHNWKMLLFNCLFGGLAWLIGDMGTFVMCICL